MQLVPVNDTDKGIVHHINPASIIGVTDYTAYRIVIFGHDRLIHTKQTLDEIKKAIEDAELRAQWQPGDSPYFNYDQAAFEAAAEAATDRGEGIVCLDTRSTADEL